MQPRRAMVAVLTLALAAPVTAVVTTQAANAAGTGLNAQKLPRPERQLDRTPKFDKDSVLVKFKKSASKSSRDKALSSRGAKSLGQVKGTSFVKVKSSGKAAELVKALKKDKSVAEVSLDYVRSIAATPNDPGYTYKYPDGSHDQDYLKTLRLPQAWDLSKGTSTTKIAVLDTGVNGAHEDLYGKVLAGRNIINGTGIPANANSDDNGHGSFVAGVAAAKTNNSKGIAGVDWNARILPVKVLDSAGNGLDSDVADGITWAAYSGAKVINLSLGGPEDTPVLREAVAYATAKGAVVVAASGNDGGQEPHYPAAIPEVIAVGATDWKGALTDFSNGGDWVDVVAPGWGVLSLGNGAVNPWEDYWINDGTSFSAPLVAGVISLMRTKYPSLTPAQVASRLRQTARDAGPRGFDPYYGAGVVDAYYALGGSYTTDFPQTGLGGDEPNEAPARATALATPSDTGVIGIEGDVDWYKYTSTSTRAVDLKVTPPAYNGNNPQNMDAAIAVYDGSYRLVAEMDAYTTGYSETVGFTMGGTAEAPKTYYAAVRNWNGARLTSAYGVSLTTNTTGRLLDPRQLKPMATSIETATAIGDLNGDGKDDVVATRRHHDGLTLDSDVVVFHQTAAGGLDEGTDYTTFERKAPASLAIGDVDGNGKQDLVVGAEYGPEVRLQSDNGNLGAPTRLPAYLVNAVATGDFDGDGDDEVVAAGNGSTLLYSRKSDGTYDAVSIGETGYALDPTVGDVDGDGRLDVVIGGSSTLRVLHNTASGWTESSVGTIGVGALGGIAIADVTGDGKKDVLATSIEGGSGAALKVFAQTAEGGLADPTSVSLPDGAGPLVTGDVTGDGKDDAVIAHSNGKVSVRPQLEAGGLGAARTTPVKGQTSYAFGALSLGDYTGDGKADAAVPDAAALNGTGQVVGAPGIALLRNSTAPTAGGEATWIQSVTPADTATGLGAGTQPKIVFARTVDPATVNDATVQLVNGKTGAAVPATVTYDEGTKTATLKPTTALWDFTPFRITVSGVADADGIAMGETFSTTFRTMDLPPPPVTNLTAKGGLNQATLSWSFPQGSDFAAIVVRMAAGSTPPSSIGSGTQVYSGFSPTATIKGLTNGATYSFRVWVKDRQGKISTTAPSVKLIGTGATISSNTTSLRVGSTVTITGKVTRRDSGAGLASVPVQLQYRRKGASTWSLLTTRTSSSTGTVSYAHKPGWSIEYRWVYSGTPQLMGTSSPARVVTVS